MLIKIGFQFLGFVKNLFKKQTNVLSLNEALKVGKVKIVARKKDGTITERIATKNESYLECFGLEPKGTKNSPSHLITFVDTAINEWRSFDKTNIQSVELVGNKNITITY